MSLFLTFNDRWCQIHDVFCRTCRWRSSLYLLGWDLWSWYSRNHNRKWLFCPTWHFLSDLLTYFSTCVPLKVRTTDSSRKQLSERGRESETVQRPFVFKSSLSQRRVAGGNCTRTCSMFSNTEAVCVASELWMSHTSQVNSTYYLFWKYPACSVISVDLLVWIHFSMFGVVMPSVSGAVFMCVQTNWPFLGWHAKRILGEMCCGFFKHSLFATGFLCDSYLYSSGLMLVNETRLAPHLTYMTLKAVLVFCIRSIIADSASLNIKGLEAFVFVYHV